MDCSAKGAQAELLASAYLMEIGYEVYRAVSPSAPCDLIAVREHLILRVQVRLACRTPSGAYQVSGGDPTRYDVLAAVYPPKVVLLQNGHQVPEGVRARPTGYLIAQEAFGGP